VLSTAAVLVMGNTTDVKEAQESNAEVPILVTAAGIAIASRPLFANAFPPIDVSELGRSIDVKAVQPSKALFGIVVQPAGTVTSPLPSGGYMQGQVNLEPE
jgi:hypothetical protein